MFIALVDPFGFSKIYILEVPVNDHCFWAVMIRYVIGINKVGGIHGCQLGKLFDNYYYLVY